MIILQINQILPDITCGDAISNHALEIKNILKSCGYESEIFAQRVHPKLGHVIKNCNDYKKLSSSENIIIFHFSIGSEVSRFVKNLPDKKILIYHNITPYNYFVGINDTLAQLLKNGRKELTEFSNMTCLALGDSEYNQRDLAELGFENTGVLPIIVDFDKYGQEPDNKILDKFTDDYTNFIFVGRLSPNKKEEDIVKVFYYYNKCINQKSRLFLVGSYVGTERYYVQLKELIKRLNLENVYITGKVNFKELLAYYNLADVFISMSEHEGFCVPLLESMYFDIPIIAYNSSAVPDTLNGAGILVNEKLYKEIAEIANIMVEDKSMRNRIIDKQKNRLDDFKKTKVEEMLKHFLTQVGRE